ncbi:protein kinase domain-containing protein [Embleya sp. AB8]|uniref:protein kinase domain-containing protein n=1 Tax=Embleya sp. AB8 TaxID=3156304 RepID=UPI003C73C4D5
MHVRYSDFCRADRRFYDSPDRCRSGPDAPSTRLGGEYVVLAELTGIPGVPFVHDQHVLGGAHEFVAVEYPLGISLDSWMTLNYPDPDPGPDPDPDPDLDLDPDADDPERPGVAKYLEAVDRIIARLAATLAAIHARGYVFNDLHPGNVLIDDDLNPSLIDFGAARPMHDTGPSPVGTAGFAAPGGIRGVAADRYSLNAVRLFLYLPLNNLLALCPAKAPMLIAEARERFGLGYDVVVPLARALATGSDSAASGLRPAGPELAFGSAVGPWERHTEALVASIRAAATPDRRDRLFPGDIAQFVHGGGGIAFGAAGVLDTLHAAGADDLDQAVDWLERDLRAGRGLRFGLYDGAAGGCHVLYNLGRIDTALALYDDTVAAIPATIGVTLFDGLAGIGLTALDFHRRTAGQRNYLDHARELAEAVEAAIASGDHPPHPSHSPHSPHPPAEAIPRDRTGNAVADVTPGLLYGWSGPALFLVRMYEVSGDERWLHAAQAAIHRDLDAHRPLPIRSLPIRMLPSLATGGAGIALVCDLVLRHRHDDRLAASVPALVPARADDACVGGGLFNGRAGLVGTLHALGARSHRPHLAARVDAGLRALDLYALTDEHGLIFPGERNLRASLDLATGSAGVLRLINMLAGRTSEILPFTGPASWAAS